MNIVTINRDMKTEKQSKAWQLCVGSGHAALALREDWRKQLKYIHDTLGFKYVRFHGLFNDDMNVVTALKGIMPLPGSDKIRTISFYEIGNVFDYILSIGMKPFIEIGFMPSLLASGKKTIFKYKANITMPKHMDEWRELIRAFTGFLIDRYGIDEVRSWYFEIWNEPDLHHFFAGKQKDYFKLYKNTAEAIKSVDDALIVGGPATSGNRWIEATIDFCETEGVALDFITTHQYPGNALGHSTPGGLSYIRTLMKKVKESKGSEVQPFMEKLFDPTDKLKNANRGDLTEQVIKARKEAGDYPLIYTEWNSNSALTSTYNDSVYTSAFIIKTVLDHKDYVDGYSFWTFSDLFEELGMHYGPFSGGFGMLTVNGIEKPSYWAFKLLSELYDDRVQCPGQIEGSKTLDKYIFKKGDSYQVILCNQQMPGKPVESERVSLQVEGIASDVKVKRIDEEHGNPKRVWIEHGRKSYLKQDEVDQIRRLAEVTEEKMDVTYQESSTVFELTLPPNGVARVSFDRRS